MFSPKENGLLATYNYGTKNVLFLKCTNFSVTVYIAKQQNMFPIFTLADIKNYIDNCTGAYLVACLTF